MHCRPFNRAILASLGISLASLAGCNYTFSGGGGLPSNIKTVYVAPIENNTTQFALTQSFTDKLLESVRRRLGVQLASEVDADATIVAALTRYDDSAINFQGIEDVGAAVFQRRVSISASVEIVDVLQNEIIWNSSGVNGAGEYSPSDPGGEAVGQDVALDNLVQKILDGAQSQW